MNSQPEPVVDAVEVLGHHKKSAKNLLNECIEIITKCPIRHTPWIACASTEPKSTKRNRVRFDPDDRTSPLGIIVRDDPVMDVLFPTAGARFNAYELASWIAQFVEEKE